MKSLGIRLTLLGLCVSAGAVGLYGYYRASSHSPGKTELAHNLMELGPTAGQLRRQWPRFRGADGSGISTCTNIPTVWDATTGSGVLWKTQVPLPGASSPIIWDQRVFLTGATADQRAVYAFDLESGELLWQQAVDAHPGGDLSVGASTGYAAPSPATDGERVFAVFAGGELVCCDFGGDVVWRRELGNPQNSYGHAASLCVIGGLLIVPFDQGRRADGNSRLLALDSRSGQIVWEVPRDVPESWSSPVVNRSADEIQIITCSDPWTIAYSVDGRELWRNSCLAGDVGPSPVVAGETAFVVSEHSALTAVRLGGTGDVTETHTAWIAEDGLPDICSPLVTADHVLVLASYGTLTGYDRDTGGLAWEEDFETGFASSPSLVDNRVYLFAKDGRSWVVEVGPDGCKRLHEGTIGEACVTSPAFSEGRLLIRGERHLLCMGQPRDRSTTAAVKRDE